jgi:hypothetical protein
MYVHNNLPSSTFDTQHCSYHHVSRTEGDTDFLDPPVADVIWSITLNAGQASQPSHRLPHVIVTISVYTLVINSSLFVELSSA